MTTEFVLLHESLHGVRTKLLGMPGRMETESLGAVADMLTRMEEHEAVSFRRFDLADLRTVEAFKARATEIGWENYESDIAG